MKWVGGKYGEFGGEIERTYKRECQVTVCGQRRVFLSENAHNQVFMSKYPRNSSAVKFCLRRAAFLNFSSSWAESESDSESFEAGGQMSESA